MSERKETHGFLYGLLASFFLAVMSLFIKWAHDVPTEMTVLFRFLIGLVALTPWLSRHTKLFPWKHLPKHVMRSVMGLIGMYCFFYTIGQLPLVNALTLANTTPLFIPLLYFVFQKLVIPMRRILAIGVGFIGVFLILNPSVHFQGATLIGLLGGFCVAIAYMGIRELSKVESTESILFHYFFLSSAVSIFPAYFAWQTLTSIQWFYIALIGLTGAVFQYLLTMSYTHAPATKVSLLNYLAVIFSGIFGWIFWDEVPALVNIAGVALIIAGGMIALLDTGKPRRLQ